LTESRFKDREYRRELNGNAIVEEVKRREAMCSELKSALLLKSINSIIYREYDGTSCCCMAERNRQENTLTGAQFRSKAYVVEHRKS